MVLRATVKYDDKDVRRLIESAPSALRSAQHRTLRRAGALVTKRAKVNLRKGTFPSVVTGTLTQSVGFSVDKEKMTVTVGPALSAKVSAGGGDPASYGLQVEEGREPGRAPPPHTLDQFVRRRLDVSEAREFSSTRYLVGQAIAREGVPAKPWLGPALDATEEDFQRILQEEVDREIDRLG